MMLWYAALDISDPKRDEREGYRTKLNDLSSEYMICSIFALYLLYNSSNHAYEIPSAHRCDRSGIFPI